MKGKCSPARLCFQPHLRCGFSPAPLIMSQTGPLAAARAAARSRRGLCSLVHSSVAGHGLTKPGGGACPAAGPSAKCSGKGLLFVFGSWKLISPSVVGEEALRQAVERLTSRRTLGPVKDRRKDPKCTGLCCQKLSVFPRRPGHFLHVPPRLQFVVRKDSHLPVLMPC